VAIEEVVMFNVPLTLGIEEEYQIIHPESRDLHSYVQEFLDQGQQVFPDGQLKPEFMQSQVEVGSYVCRDVKELRREVVRLRKKVYSLAEENNLKFAAASTHPFASWSTQNITAGERYRELLDQLQGVAEQLLIFGMHIHIGIGESPQEKNLMIDLMNQLRYFLPHILALSTSSPFWQGRNTGLKSYRSVIFEMMPRTGIPQTFSSYSEYEDFVDLLGAAGTIIGKDRAGKPDATKIWWDVRPHPKFGTLEIRVSDICTRVDEAVCIAALIQAIVAKLIKLRKQNQSWRQYRRHHIVENKWRAMRYGIDGKLIDFGKREAIPMHFLGIELIELVDDVVDELGSREEVAFVEKILTEGTSADRQVRVYLRTLAEGGTETEALHAVVDHLVAETIEGVDLSLS
jgi:carboxylate-amine ligase